MKISVQLKKTAQDASSRGRVPRGHAALPLNVIATRKSRTDYPSSANVIAFFVAQMEAPLAPSRRVCAGENNRWLEHRQTCFHSHEIIP